MRSAAPLLLLLFACKPIPLDLGDDPDGETTGASSEPITSSSDGVSSTGPITGSDSGIAETGVAPLEPGSRCDPSLDTCSEGTVCCSDDPATPGGKLPNYFNPGVVDEKYGAPLFSDANNALSSSGECLVVGGFSTPLANECAVPCNPTWTAGRIQEICGVSGGCCQRQDLDPDKDCVIDPITGHWRAVTGHDIGTPLTTWGDQHTTNQDPIGAGCNIFANAGGELDEEALADCYAQLSVADQRGFCQAPGTCPCFEDLCDMKNPGWVPRCP